MIVELKVNGLNVWIQCNAHNYHDLMIFYNDNNRTENLIVLEVDCYLLWYTFLRSIDFKLCKKLIQFKVIIGILKKSWIHFADSWAPANWS